MSQVLAGFTYKEADKLRKACGKKIVSIFHEMRPKFYEGCLKNNVPEETAKEMWEIAVKFGEYAFNKSHSCAYAEITYQTAFLKTYYPEEFISAYLTSKAQKDEEDLRKSIDNFKKEYKDLDIVSPDINLSKETYIPSDKKMQIIAPFYTIKSIGKRVSEHIAELQPFISVEHFLECIDKSIVTNKTLEMLVEINAFRSFGSKEQVFLEIKKHEQLCSLVKPANKKKLLLNSTDLF
jgi:DNA polymerase-3 subunit alpha